MKMVTKSEWGEVLEAAGIGHTSPSLYGVHVAPASWAAWRGHPLRKCDLVVVLDLFEALQSFHTNHMLATIKSGDQDGKPGSAWWYLYDLGNLPPSLDLSSLPAE